MNRSLVLISPDRSEHASARLALEGSGAQLVSYATATAWLAALRRPGPACALIDCALEDMVPLQVLAELAQRGLQVPLLFLVCRERVELAVSLMKAGAQDVLVKPLHASSLREQATTALAARARAVGQGAATRQRLARLTARELEVVALATTGRTNKDIAEQLGLSFRTVEVHRRNALQKTGAANMIELMHLLTPRGNRAAPLGTLSVRVQELHALINEDQGGPPAAPGEATGAADQLQLFATGERLGGIR